MHAPIREHTDADGHSCEGPLISVCASVRASRLHRLRRGAVGRGEGQGLPSPRGVERPAGAEHLRVGRDRDDCRVTCGRFLSILVP